MLMLNVVSVSAEVVQKLKMSDKSESRWSLIVRVQKILGRMCSGTAWGGSTTTKTNPPLTTFNFEFSRLIVLCSLFRSDHKIIGRI